MVKMNLLHNCNKERKIIIDEMKKLKYNYKKIRSIKHIIKDISIELTNKKLLVFNLSYFNIFVLLIIFSLKYIISIKIVLIIVSFFYLKYLIHHLLLFLYNYNLHKFNEVIKLLYKYEYAKIANGINVKNDLIIDDIYNSIYRITKSILSIYFFFMKNTFSYLFEYNNIEEIYNSSCSKNLKKLCYLKDFYFSLFIVLFELKIKKSYSEKEEKRKLYKNIRNIFKEKYKKDYKMMETSENSPFIFYFYQSFHDIIKYMFYFSHFFIFIFISIFYLSRSYFILSSYKNILKKKSNLFLTKSEKINKQNILEGKNEIISLLVDSLILLNFIHKNDKDEENYKLIENKLHNSINLIKSLKNKITKKLETKSFIRNNNLEIKDIKEDESKKNFINYLPYEEKNVYETETKLIENSIIENIEKEKYLTYDIYYYDNKEGENCEEKKNCNEQKNNYSILNGPNNRMISKEELNEENELQNSINTYSYINKYSNNKKEIEYKKEYCISSNDKDIYKEICIDNLLKELRIRFKKRRNYKYVKKKLCYDSNKKDFCIKNISSNDIDLLNEYDKCTEETTKQHKIVKISDNNENIQETVSDKIIMKNNYLCKEEDQDIYESDFLKPIENISSFREKIASSILQRNLIQK
ncbi:conserved Plasmodium protein, unknown function [Plasmodium gallinaceum]|uniref:Uncharacterized protein n=1 Tax=Plasmodium gallinaceum TaxID=5849 RepID=A0A1J1GXB5_PLAGA|nr:conserved Plasmodium protein, unknown function [Plasmodium gallinaceum]CRG96934.1 conserved Plasmodium protein, unknown function [Plasmodium gallinaceum]